MIEGSGDEEAGVDGIPDGRGDGKFVSIEVKEAVMVGDQQPWGFVTGWLVGVENSSGTVGCSGEKVPSFGGIDLQKLK
jgi:hypothetical protein